MNPRIRKMVLRSAAFRRLKPRVREGLRQLGYQVVPTRSSELQLREHLLRSLDVNLLIDVGANEGQYASEFIAMGFTGDVISFEPMAKAFSGLERRATRSARWSARRVGLSDRPGVATLNVSDNSVSSSLLLITKAHTDAEPLSKVQRQEEVPVATLDQEIRGAWTAKRAWLKLDVQGLEAAVLRGGERTLRQCQVVQCELSTAGLYEGQSGYLEVLGLLDAAGFTLVDVVPGFSDPATGRLLQFDVVAAREQ